MGHLAVYRPAPSSVIMTLRLIAPLKGAEMSMSVDHSEALARIDPHPGLARGYLPDRKLLTRNEVVNWIGFRIASDDEILGRAYFWRAWWAALPDLSPNGEEPRYLPDHALRAMASGIPYWNPQQFPAGTSDKVVQRAAIKPPPVIEEEERYALLVERSGTTPAALLDRLQADIAAFRSRQRAYEDAQVELHEAIGEGRLTFKDRPPAVGAYRNLPADVSWLAKGDVCRLWPFIPGRPDQPAVNNWILAHYKTAATEGRSKPKSADVIILCRSEIGATVNQAKAAVSAVPADLRLSVGEKT
jgi:hypothetical protein